METSKNEKARGIHSGEQKILNELVKAIELAARLASDVRLAPTSLLA